MIGENQKQTAPTVPIEEFLKTATTEQKQLLLDLYDVVEKEVEIVEKINNIYKSMDKGTCSVNGGITVCESGDDANIISIQLKIELKAVRSEVGALLKKAANELGMGNLGIISRHYNNYIT